MAASLASCEAIWLHKLLTGLFGQELEPTVIHCDNQSCIKLSENPVFHDRSKHIEINTTSSETGCRREQFNSNIFLQRSSWQTFSPSPWSRASSSSSETSLEWWRIPSSLRGSVSVCSSDRYFRKGVYLRKSSLNVSYTFPRIHFINLLIK
jgi:hypothetical protein